jgi:hypothetical protein
MPNKVDAVLLATATTLMWRGVDRGADLLGIESSSVARTNRFWVVPALLPAGAACNHVDWSRWLKRRKYHTQFTRKMTP